MAQRTVVHLEDDIDGSDASETISFGLDGSSYEIDLNEKNAAELRDALAPYVAVARRAGGGSSSRSSRSAAAAPRAARSSGGGEVDPKAVRSWAEAQGIAVNARGRLKSDVIEQYKAAH